MTWADERARDRMSWRDMDMAAALQAADRARRERATCYAWRRAPAGRDGWTWFVRTLAEGVTGGAELVAVAGPDGELLPVFGVEVEVGTATGPEWRAVHPSRPAAPYRWEGRADAEAAGRAGEDVPGRYRWRVSVDWGRVLPAEVELREAVGGRYFVTVRGFQWGPVGSVPDRSGAYPDTWATAAEAVTAYLAGGGA